MCSTAWNVMCTACVVFASQVMCAAAREGTHLITATIGSNITMPQGITSLIAYCEAITIYITKKLPRAPEATPSARRAQLGFASRSASHLRPRGRGAE